MTDFGKPSRFNLDAEFQALFLAEYGYVCKTVRRLGVAEADIPDVAHEVFVTFFRRRAEYDSARPLRPWLFGIAFRTCSDHRRLSRHRKELLDDPPERADPNSDVERQVIAREAQRLVIAALDRVPAERRAVFVVHELDGFQMPEITSVLQVPLNTGYSRLRLARKEFAEAVLALRAKGDV